LLEVASVGEMSCCVRPGVVKFNCFLASLGFCLGLTAFFAFGLYFKNEHAAVWGLVSGTLEIRFPCHFLNLISLCAIHLSNQELVPFIALVNILHYGYED
jgi:hypothetical protein